MRPAISGIEDKIKKAALELLMEKEPDEIGMRDIAKKCSVTATTIYNYFKDKDSLFRCITKDKLCILSDDISRAVMAASDSREKIAQALRTFRDWCFSNPKVAFLVMEKVPSDEQTTNDNYDAYYACHEIGQKLMEDCVREHKAVCSDARLFVNMAVSGLWGNIVAVITQRTVPEYWENGIAYTDKFIDFMLKSVFIEGSAGN